MPWFKFLSLFTLLEIVSVKTEFLRNLSPLNAVSITSGEYHSCVLLEPGKGVKCFGDNLSGQLGLGLDPGTRDSPTLNNVVGGNPEQLGNNLAFVKLSSHNYSVIQVEAGAYHTCALLDVNVSARMKCWGSNNKLWRQLGIGESVPTRIGRYMNEMVDNLAFVNFGYNATVVQISAGYAHTCILFDDSGVKCWGWNNYGQLGLGDRLGVGDPSQRSTIDFGIGNVVVQISAGTTHTCAILSKGSVMCWGNNKAGQVSFDAEDVNELYLSPIALQLNGSIASQVSAGGSHTCAIVDNGEVKCWGDNTYGQLGCGYDNSMYEAELDILVKFPQEEAGNLEMKQVVAGEYHTCALSNMEQIYCWGRNDEGQLGTGDTLSRNVPTQIVVDLPVSQISLGTKHTCALFEDESVRCWGGNKKGQLATGYHEDIISPAFAQPINLGSMTASK